MAVRPERYPQRFPVALGLILIGGVTLSQRGFYSCTEREIVAVTETTRSKLTELTGEQRVLTDQFMEHLEEALAIEAGANSVLKDSGTIAAFGAAQHQLAGELDADAYPSPEFVAGCTKNDAATLLWEILGTGFTRWEKVAAGKALAAVRTVRAKLNVTSM